MDPVIAVRMYIDKMIQNSGPGMKILLMDKETTGIVSSVYSQTEIMQKEVFLCDRLDNYSGREQLRHLKCLTFLRPTEENIEKLCYELKAPLYASYFLHWSNVIAKADVKRLAEADEQELVREVSEFFADFLPLSPKAFMAPVNLTKSPFSDGDLLHEDIAHSIGLSLTAFLLGVKKIPVVRYTEWSMPTQKLADKLSNLINKESNLFDFGRSPPKSLLLILDRRDDAVTPLLNQWTYQAMVHELLTIKNHRVSMQNSPAVPKDFKEVVLCPDNDKFFSDHMYSDFGVVGISLRQLVEEFQGKVKSQQKVESIDDMKAFIENYPSFKQMSGTVSKHVAVVGELARLNETNCLLQVSELEQEIACHSNHSQSLSKIKNILSNPKIQNLDALRLVLLYALKFESHSNNDITGLMVKLKSRGISEDDVGLVKSILKFGGDKKRKSDLFGMDPVAVTKRFMKGLQGVENIYTQHTPWLKGIVEDCMKGKLKETSFPYFNRGMDVNWRPSEILVFVIGGITYEEVLAINNLCKAEPRVDIILGGTAIHNATSFIEEVRGSSRVKK